MIDARTTHHAWGQGPYRSMTQTSERTSQMSTHRALAERFAQTLTDHDFATPQNL